MGAFLYRLAFSTRANLLVAALLPVVLLGLILSIYLDIIDLDGVAQAIPINENAESLSKLGAHLANINNVLQGTISYILTIQLGIFLTIGFSFGITLQKGHTPSSFILLLHLIFLGCAVLSFHYGYAAYLLLAERIVAAYLDYGVVNSAIARQGMFTAIGGAIGFCAAAINLFLSLQHAEPAETLPPEEKPVAAKAARRDSKAASAVPVLLAALCLALTMAGPALAGSKPVCDTASLLKAVRSLPPEALVIGDGESEESFFSKTFTCDYAAYRKMLANKTARLEKRGVKFGASGEEAGTPGRKPRRYWYMARRHYTPDYWSDPSGLTEEEKRNILNDELRLYSDLYFVAEGDTLSTIAERHDTSLEALKTANAIKGDRLRIGQSLLVPRLRSEADVTDTELAWLPGRGTDAALDQTIRRLAAKRKDKDFMGFRVEATSYDTGTVRIRFESIPERADIYVAGRLLGQTKSSAFVPIETLGAMEIRMAGYQPCSSAELDPETPVFTCDLKPVVPADPAPK